MERRAHLGAAGGVAPSAVAAVDRFAPELIVGSPQAEREIPRTTLVHAAPQTVEATVTLAGRTHTRDVPVFVEELPEAVRCRR